jgi:hypothetical protein
LFATEPGLGIAFALLITPSLVRTTIVAARRRQAGRPMTWTEMGWAFLASVGLLVGLGTALVVSAFVNCLAGLVVGSPFNAEVEGLFVGIGAGLLLSVAGAVARTIQFVKLRKSAGRSPLPEEIVRVALVSMLWFTLFGLGALAAGGLIVGIGMIFTGGDLDLRVTPALLLGFGVAAAVLWKLSTWLWNSGPD